MSEATTNLDHGNNAGPIVLGESPEGTVQIEKMLSRLWSEVSDTGSQSPHRLCLANLIVVGRKSDQQLLETFSAALSSSYPSRVIHASVDPAAHALTAVVSAACQKGPSGDDVVCWEKISLVVPKFEDEALTSVVRSLLVGRVATVVVLALSPEDWPALVDGALRWADLLITDDSGRSLVPRLLYWDRHGCRRTWTNWVSRPWESLIASRQILINALDDPDARQALLEAGEIECVGPSLPACRLILGWIVSRLGWVILGQDPGGGIVVRRAPVTEGAALLMMRTGSGLSIHLSGSGIKPRSLQLQVDDDLRKSIGWDSPGWSELVIESLHRDESDHVFLSAVDAAVQLEVRSSGRPASPRLAVAPHSQELAKRAAERFTELSLSAVRENGRFLVALSGGRTPEGLYRQLVKSPLRERVPWDGIEWFWGDERWVPHDHQKSNYGMAKRVLLDNVPVPSALVHPIPTDRDSASDAADVYESAIRDTAGVQCGVVPCFDLILLGIGTDGHTASWFPDVELDAAVQRLVWGGFVASVDEFRVSLTPRAINSARHIMFIASGRAKADIVARTLYPPWENRHPAACIEPVTGEVEWFLDDESAGDINPADFSSCTLG